MASTWGIFLVVLAIKNIGVFSVQMEFLLDLSYIQYSTIRARATLHLVFKDNSGF
jgi:energy-converting hydrogenase Eha subunit H